MARRINEDPENVVIVQRRELNAANARIIELELQLTRERQAAQKDLNAAQEEIDELETSLEEARKECDQADRMTQERDDRIEELLLFGGEPECNCASGTAHNNGWAIGYAIREQHLRRLWRA